MLIGTLLNLSIRLRGPHPRATEFASNYSEDDLASVSYTDIDMLDAIPRNPTHEGYVVIGGSGFVGSYIVRLLILRGETNVRVLDLAPPPQDFASHPSLTFTKVDITSPSSVRSALVTPFPSGVLPSVIFHTAATIRFWERAAYTFDASHRVNKTPTGVIVVYTSSADVAIPTSRFMQLDKHYELPPWNKIIISDDDEPLRGSAAPRSSYGRSKIIAERLVLEANSVDGLRTGSLRPGQTITGPNDRFYTSTLVFPRVPVFDSLWSHTNVCVWDVAAAHLTFEDALRRDPANVGGEAFLITGNGPPWSMKDSRAALKYYSRRELIFDDVQPLLVFLLAHIGQRPGLTPRWMGELIYLQPATLEYMRDVVIDDSRARKMIGYRPQWQTAQVMKYTVDQLESGNGKTDIRHGLQLSSAGS
ncbi:hypothetical protein B0F90DRAFT_1809207 [Multifurca ochricompacta]|uniref:3-beta hydroxysteroid dehydrogenase/isomerase domain-containing protein n=1 Tax=Multifurca ochricompacta TaxID=376703 RepID=A0AAD4M7U4_9AGAM|nr:hypothetical protein B0F90DRAFT_1809207 [Multifurca ochricompacta]